MSDAEPPAPKPASQLSTPPKAPVIADALRALGPDYEQALVDSIAARVDELAREREARAHTATPPAQAHPLQFPGAPGPLPVAAPPSRPAAPPAPPAPAPYTPPGAHHRPGRPVGPTVPVSILSLIFGFVITVVALTAGLAISGPPALIAILVVWLAIVLINFAAWGGPRRPGQ